MIQNTVARLALCAVAFFSLSAFQYGTVPLLYNPDHYVNDDPAWDLLSDAQVSSDMKQGVYNATFPADLRSLENKPFKISGFMLPLESSPASAHFALIRRNSACPFCPPNSPKEAIEVMANTKVRYTGEEVSVNGRLKLVGSSVNGLFFRLEAADVKED